MKKQAYQKWVIDALMLDDFKVEHDSVIYQWAKYEDPEQNIDVFTKPNSNENN